MAAMHDTLSVESTPRRPIQERSRARFERVLEEAEELLLEVGLEGFSIPTVAERTGYTRGSVYAYFPTPHALLNELARRYLAELEASYVAGAGELVRLPWKKGIEAVVARAAAYYNARPVARLLLLSGAIADEGYRARETTLQRLGVLGREVMKKRGLILPARSPDVATLVADIGQACLRRSVVQHGTVVPAYRDAAVKAMVAFLEPYVTSAKKRRKR